MSKIKKIKQKYEDALTNPNYNFGLVQEIISEIHALPPREKSLLEEFYTKIGHDLIERNLSVPNYDQALFIEKNRNWERKKEVKSNKKELKTEKRSNFESQLNEFAKSIKNEIINLRIWFLLKTGNNDEEDTRIVLLHDSNSKNPILDKIQKKSNSEYQVTETSSFIKKISSDKNYRSGNFLILLLLSPDPTAKIGFDFIKDLEKKFDRIEQINITDFDNPEVGLKVEKDIEKIKKEIKYSVEINLANKYLEPSEEKILKKLFQDLYCHTLEYKRLGGGFSGAKVLEVQPLKVYGKTIKFVVKLNNAVNSKIKSEIENFNMHVKGYDNLYTIEIAETEKHKAIKYIYASGDGTTESTPYAKKLSDEISGKKDTLINDLEKLFQVKLFKQWEDYKIRKEEEAKHFYKEFVNIEKISEEIAKICNIPLNKVALEQIVKNFYKISEYKTNTFEKVCHGDLHTDNFFVDEKGSIFLIDFGNTGLQHAVIDHVTLECSIKFKHIPKYIQIEELIEMEKELLS